MDTNFYNAASHVSEAEIAANESLFVPSINSLLRLGVIQMLTLLCSLRTVITLPLMALMHVGAPRLQRLTVLSSGGHLRKAPGWSMSVFRWKFDFYHPMWL